MPSAARSPTTHAGETAIAQVLKREPTKYPGIYKETYVSGTVRYKAHARRNGKQTTGTFADLDDAKLFKADNDVRLLHQLKLRLAYEHLSEIIIDKFDIYSFKETDHVLHPLAKATVKHTTIDNAIDRFEDELWKVRELAWFI